MLLPTHHCRLPGVSHQATASPTALCTGRHCFQHNQICGSAAPSSPWRLLSHRVEARRETCTWEGRDTLAWWWEPRFESGSGLLRNSQAQVWALGEARAVVSLMRGWAAQWRLHGDPWVKKDGKVAICVTSIHCRCVLEVRGAISELLFSSLCVRDLLTPAQARTMSGAHGHSLTGWTSRHGWDGAPAPG